MQILNNSLLNNELIQEVNDSVVKDLPEKVIQFGQGNFMRGYIDWMIDEMNKQGLFNGKVVVVQPRSQGPTIPLLNEQDGLYTLILRGIQQNSVVDKHEIITSISRGLNAINEWDEVLKVAESEELEFVFSNTTEAGIAYVKEDFNIGEPPSSYPGKLTAFLYHRFSTFNGSDNKGLIIVPCELVEDNGQKLKEIVRQKIADWHLPSEFAEWVEKHNYFCHTLVDRIVTGFPKDDLEYFHQLLGYKDNFLTIGEPYHLFAIDADEIVREKLPLDKAGINVKWGDITPYREIKVRLLNGPHTLMFAVGYLAGVDTVQEVMQDEELLAFVERGFTEILPVVDGSEEEKNEFAKNVKERFLNPFTKHYLTDIGLNSINKFKTRLLPVIHRYLEQQGSLPSGICFSFAALLHYYRPIRVEEQYLIGNRDGQEYKIQEDEKVLKLFLQEWEKVAHHQKTVRDFVVTILAEEEIWGEDLNKIQDLAETITFYVQEILANGMRMTVRNYLK